MIFNLVQVDIPILFTFLKSFKKLNGLHQATTIHTFLVLSRLKYNITVDRQVSKGVEKIQCQHTNAYLKDQKLELSH